MGRRHFKPEQIIHMLREAEIKLASGKRIGEVSRELGISEQSYYRWRKEYGGMQVSQAKRLKDLECENAQLKKLVADQALDKSILEEALKGNY
jgi:putative transposase